MAFDAFIKIDGIPGESTDAKHKNWIEISSYRWDLNQPASATASTAGGATAERVNISPLQFSHLLDKAAPKLYETCCNGTHIREVKLEICRAGGDKMVYFEVTLNQVIVSNCSASSSIGEDFPSQIVTLSAGSYTWKYNQQDKQSGTNMGSVSCGWDLSTNKPKA